MDKPLAIHDKKTSKPKHRQNPQKTKKKQAAATTVVPGVKVVYISNPVNFNTSASEFRSLVQQLTGKDSLHNLDDDSTSVGGRQQQHQDDSIVDSSHNASLMEVKDLEIETEEIASSSSLLSNMDAVYNDDDVYNMADQMLDNFWYDQY